MILNIHFQIKTGRISNKTDKISNKNFYFIQNMLAVKYGNLNIFEKILARLLLIVIFSGTHCTYKDHIHYYDK